MNELDKASEQMDKYKVEIIDYERENKALLDKMDEMIERIKSSEEYRSVKDRGKKQES